MSFIKVQNFITGLINKEVTLNSFTETKKKRNKWTVFSFHKTHHFMHGAIKMNIFDDFVLD